MLEPGFGLQIDSNTDGIRLTATVGHSGLSPPLGVASHQAARMRFESGDSGPRPGPGSNRLYGFRSNEAILQAYYQAHLIGTSFFEPAISYIPNPGASPEIPGRHRDDRAADNPILISTSSARDAAMEKMRKDALKTAPDSAFC